MACGPCQAKAAAKRAAFLKRKAESKAAAAKHGKPSVTAQDEYIDQLQKAQAHKRR